MPLTRDDVQNGHVLDGPNGEVTVAGRVLTDSGTFIVLSDDGVHGILVNEGVLYDHEDYTLKSRPAVSGVAAQQEASEVAALRAKVDKQADQIQALLDRDTLRRADEAQVEHGVRAENPDENVVVPAPGPATPSVEPNAGEGV